MRPPAPPTSTAERDGEKGATLVWVATLLFLLLAVSAFAVDLGWIYLNTSRVQNAADSAALAGVVNLPGFFNLAQADAADAASANGFPVVGNTTMTVTQLADNKLEVTLRTVIPTFFLPVVGIRTFTIARTSTAQYVKPVPLGSPSNCFGIGGPISAPPGGCTAGSQTNFWAAIQGPYTAIEHGDPYATRCDWAATGPNPPPPPGSCHDSVPNGYGYPYDNNADPNNPGYRPAGYYYGLDIPAGKSSFTVRLYDPGFYRRNPAFSQTGDEDRLAFSTTGGMATHFQLYAVDTTPQDPTDNPPIGSCALTVNSGASPGTYENRWVTLCSVGSPTPGIYVLRVWSTGNTGGSNSYAVNVSTNPSTGSQPRVYGINDMSIFTNQPSGSATVYLAEIQPIHAGKKLELKFYDPGEGNGNAYMTVRMPDGTVPNCSWSAENLDGAQTASGTGQCRIQTTVNGAARFNKQWITAYIDIPPTYTCSSDCFWKMNLDLNTSHDRTTWQARVIGNPVRLVPNP